MSTRSTIAILYPGGNNESIYCHYDGYPEHVGKVLLENYNSTSIVQALMRLGDLSSLGPLLVRPSGQPHSYYAQCKDVTVAYRRDRGETDCLAKRSPSLNLLLKGFAAGDNGADYLYIWHVDDEAWYYAESSHPKSLHKLSWKRCGANTTPKAPKAANEVVFNLKKLVYEDKVDNTQTLTELSAQLVELRDTMNVAFNNISKTLLKLK
jgi:hypothetical protein